MARRTPNPLSDAERRLAEMEERIRREEEELKRLINEAPKKRTTPAEPPPRRVRLDLATGHPPPQPASFRIPQAYGRSERPVRGKRSRRQEQRMAQIKFLCLCILLAVMVLLLWRSLPH